MRKQHHFWPADPNFDAWDVDHLIALSRDLSIERVTVESIGLHERFWTVGPRSRLCASRCCPNRTIYTADPTNCLTDACRQTRGGRA